MCHSCWEEAGSPSIINRRTIEASKLIDDIYKYNGVGGNAHIVVDDWNLNARDIKWCLDSALPDNIHEASSSELAAERKCLEYLLKLKVKERYSAMALHSGYLQPPTPNSERKP